MNLGAEFAELSFFKKHHNDCEFILPDIVSQEDVIDFLRKLSVMIDSSKLYKMLFSVIDKFMANEININDFSEMYPFDTDYELKVLQLFASRKAKQISDFSIRKRALDCTAAPLIEPRMWTEITKLKNVQTLSINKRQFLLKDLMEMCKNMPSLNQIKVLIDSGSPLPMNDPNFAREFSHSFDKIKKFLFVPTGCYFEDFLLRFSGNLTNFGIKHLPNLNRILPIGKNCDMSKGCKEMDKTSQLEHVRLSSIYLEEFASKFDQFPMVQSLEMRCNNEWNNAREDNKINKKKLELLKKFKKLNELRLTNLASPENLAVLLNNLGPQLELLDLNTDHKMKINLKQIQKTCPLLSTLEINVADVVEESCPLLPALDIAMADVEESQSMTSFTSLRYLQIVCDTNISEKVRLINLLSPPNLEMVYLRGFHVTRQELQETTSKIKDKTIFTKVNKLGLFLNGETSGKMKVALEIEGKRLTEYFLHLNFTVRELQKP
ncbi:Hypothetical predicted protein [Cloeon dipterum]|uniref:Uncharacterized protein n=1 Tax=Cloeon dipterum TaxID=197152 RepID=A0A8S1CUA1_9INSE|nr:Hypothetical predicted protein [Cloeon dipterum]